MNFEKPKNRKALQRFIGIMNYDRCFVKGLSNLAQPLYHLLNKDVKFKWTNDHDETFEKIKKVWSETLELYIPDLNGKFELETDASLYGIGAVLRQDCKPVAYISRTLNPAERNYGITDREILAGLWAMEKLAYYLHGKKFILITDHKAIEQLKTKSVFGSARVYRWFERLERFNFTVEYRKGEEIPVADALSRGMTFIPDKNPVDNGSQVETKNDKDVSILNSKCEKVPELNTEKSFLIKEGEVSCINDKEILKIHELFGHRKNISNELNRKGINISERNLRNIILKCKVCLHKDRKNYKAKGFVETNFPGEKVGVDLMEINSNEKVIMGIDYFSRFLFAKNIRSKHSFKALDFIKALHKK
jgi:hypothetical protein